jgi:Lon protease-like protein
MISSCLSDEEAGGKARFGITNASEERSYLVGCSVLIDQITKTYDDNKIDILTTGEKRYHTIEVTQRQPFPMAIVSFFDDIDITPPSSELKKSAISLHQELTEIAHGKAEEIVIAPDGTTSFTLAHSAGLDLEQRQSLLEMTNETARLEFLVDYYNRVMPLLKQQQEVKNRILLNGHLRTHKAKDL